KPEQAASVAREALGMYPPSQFTPMLKARLAAAKRALSASDGTDAGVSGQAGSPTAATVTPAAAPSQSTAAAPMVPGDGGTSGPRSRPAMYKTAAESSAGLLPAAPANPPARQP
ncbi:MAG TPA: hypothetical protein VGK85_06275, partial [Myxococcaceae bacterium]